MEAASGPIRRHPSVSSSAHYEHLRKTSPHPLTRPSAPTPAATTTRPRRRPRGVRRGGQSTALEEIARWAGVGIGTLDRHFPTRQALLEALCIDRRGRSRRSAAQHQTARSHGTNPARQRPQHLARAASSPTSDQASNAAELLDDPDTDDLSLLEPSRASLTAAGEPLLKRAQQAGAVRPRRHHRRRHPDGHLEHRQLPGRQPAQVEHILRIALDGLRYSPPSTT